jgi:hypothetical protein
LTRRIYMTFTKRIALAGITVAAALVCSSAAQAQQECVDSFVVAGSTDGAACWTDGSGYFDITWTGGCLATNINYQLDGVDTDIDITANGFIEGFVFFGFLPGECQTITITFEDGSTAGGVEVCNDCVAAVCGDGECSAGETNADCPEDCAAGECPAGQVADCDGSGECWTEAWIGDAYCDGTAQDFGADLCCYDNDGGDCTEEQCAPIAGACCTGNACSQELPDVCAANGGTFVGGSCETFPCGSEYESCGDPAAGDCFVANDSAGCDNEACCATVCEVDDACCLAEWDAVCAEYANQFCNPNQGNCAAGEVEDCDGSGECWTEAWIGDAYCDGTAQDFGADLCCYDNDGGDCTAEQCEVQVCGDGFCGPGETPTNCPDDCDASECATITATAGDEDGSGCSADGTSGLITLTWEGGCVASTIEFVGLGTLTGVYNSGITITGIGVASECYDIIVTFDDGSIADPVNGCHNCGEPPVCGDGVCAVGETFETCPEDCDEGGCPDGQIADCDLSGECWIETWLGDGFCDGTAQAYGADLCCYETDGGDCTAEECEGGGGDPTGACCVDATCSIATEVDCAGEWQGANTTCDTDTCEVACVGDFNGDGDIGGGDLTILLAAWGTADANVDLNGDGIISGGDLTILLAAWGIPCP